MKKFNCLTCFAQLLVEDDTLIGEIVECPECGQEHELIQGSEGVVLDFAPEVEEDWGE